jgi:hypothetical protein
LPTSASAGVITQVGQKRHYTTRRGKSIAQQIEQERNVLADLRGRDLGGHAAHTSE